MKSRLSGRDTLRLMELHSIQDKRDLNNPESGFYAHLQDIPVWLEQLNKLGGKLKQTTVWYSSSDQTMLNEFCGFIHSLTKYAKAWWMRLRVLGSGKPLSTIAGLERIMDLSRDIHHVAGNAATNLLKVGEFGSQLGSVLSKLDEIYQYKEGLRP